MSTPNEVPKLRCPSLQLAARIEELKAVVENLPWALQFEKKS
jgi:hypothetical protein